MALPERKKPSTSPLVTRAGLDVAAPAVDAVAALNVAYVVAVLVALSAPLLQGEEYLGQAKSDTVAMTEVP